ncbi:hypothetical protein HJC23_003200 [Cyclotella cryptica]|uniref:Prolyl 4-hydroxylase alpha subunit domain-containing protein n=1 Tax=Cyclotella cryptica TaxID=29204 RepID=A0ABD3NQR9_9STRA
MSSSSLIVAVICCQGSQMTAFAMVAANRGFSKSNIGNLVSNQAEKSNFDEICRKTVHNLFSVCSHIQDLGLYQPKWADACEEKTTSNGRKAIIATKDVYKGQALTLFPIHALGVRCLQRDNPPKYSKQSNRSNHDVEFVANNFDCDGDLFGENGHAGALIRLSIPLDKDQPAFDPILRGVNDRLLFAMIDPSREACQGWLGGKIHSASTVRSESNCFTLPLPGAAPLCATVAIRDIKAGEELVHGANPPCVEVIDDCRDAFIQAHMTELADLRTYIEMACKPLRKKVPPATAGPQASSDMSNSTGAKEVKSSPVLENGIGPFHTINKQYPGLRQLNQSPAIFAVDNFLSADECDRLIAKALPHLQPCMVKNEATGVVEQDPSRTNTDANVRQSEVPTVVAKLTDLLLCEANQLEILQILHYSEGQTFKAHTDGFDGPTSACGFEHANRIATIFTYLNDVQLGGGTLFPYINFEIRPKRGMAVIHFPSDLLLRGDERTVHEGMSAKDEKWLLVTWLWSTPRSDKRYSEDNLLSLSSDKI